MSIRQFAADASHQRQTPLTAIKSSVELAGRRSESAVRELAEQLSGEIDDMSATLADLQALALADADLATTRSGPVDFSALAREALEIISALAEPAEITVDAQIAEDISVWGDVVRLKHVVLTLGDNAVKYSASGGRVQITLTRSNEEAILEVADTGPGIDPKHLPRIFDRFYRVDRHGLRRPGTGLGLAIVKRIVEVHGGSVHVTSVPAAGSLFNVTLPLHGDRRA